MGIFDVFTKEGRRNRALQRKIRTVANKRAADEDRYAAYQALAEDGSDEAIYGLLLRFTYVKEIGQRSRSTDEEDKQHVYDLVVGFGERALPQVHKFLLAREGPVEAPKHSISWALKILEALAPDVETQWSILQEVFEDNEPGYERDPSRKVELMTYVAGAKHLDSAAVTQAVLPYLADPDEDVRFGACEALLAHGHPDSRKPLYELLADPDESLQIRSLLLCGFIRNHWFEEASSVLPSMPLSALLAATEELWKLAEDASTQAQGEEAPELVLKARDLMLDVAEAEQADEEVLARVSEFLVQTGVTVQGARGRVERLLPKGYRVKKHRVERHADALREPYLTFATEMLLAKPDQPGATEALVRILRSPHTEPGTKGKIVEAWASGDWDLKGAEKLVAKHLPPGYTLDPHGRVRRNYEKMHEPFLSQAGDRLIAPYLREPPEDPEEAQALLDEETRTALLQIASNPKTDERTVDRILDRFAAYGWSVRGFERRLLRTMPKHFKIVSPKGGLEPRISKVSTRI